MENEEKSAKNALSELELLRKQLSDFREAGERYRIVADNTFDWEFWLNPEGRFLYVSPSCKRISGYDPDEFMNDPDLRLRIIHPDDRPIFEKHLSDVEKRTQKGEIEFRIIRPDGTIRWIGHACQPVYDKDGKFLGTRGSKRDITDLKRAELEYRAIVNTAFDGFWIVDAEGRLLDVNDAYCRMTGYSRDELLGMSISDLEAAERPEDTARHISNIRKMGSDRFETRHRRKDGSLADVEITASSPAGIEGRIIVFIRDISERKGTEAELIREKQFSESIIGSLPGVFYLFEIRETGCFLRWNRNFERVLGYSAEEMARTKPIDIFEGEERKHIAGRIREVAEKGESTAEASLVTKSGERIPYFFTGVRMIVDDTTYLVGVGVDISERRKAEFALRKAQDELEKRVLERTEELALANDLLRKQQQAFMDVSVPVVEIWERILMVPLIGIFDSKRAELLMETLLSAIEEKQGKIAILDISGIPIMDTIVAKHLLRTASAAKLMGTDCIITGIKPNISQTIVQLGVDLSGIITRATMAEGLQTAIGMI